MSCGRCCVTGPPLRPDPQLDIFIEIPFHSRVDFRRTFTLWLIDQGTRGARIDDELAELVPRANNCGPGQC